jgi:magnesium-transporting ATPase (P-type)
MVHFFALLLWAAAALALLAGLPQLTVAIAAVIVLNGSFAFVQERRAEHAAERVSDLVPRRATVVRSGRRQSIDASDVVVGDTVAVEAGDRVPADLETIAAHSLRVDTSMLTGESVPVESSPGQPLAGGCHVVEGEGLGLVTAVGAGTRLADIAALTSATTRPNSPLQREMRRLVRTISAIALTVGAGFFVIALGSSLDPIDGFVFAIGVTVALVPEALLPTVTLSLAIGAQAMARRNAIVRHLESVETLGSVTFICTDKTGTLTRNQMQVVEVWSPSGAVRLRGKGYSPTADTLGSEAALEAARRAAAVARTCSNGRIEQVAGEWAARGDPMEAAVDAAYLRLGAADVAGVPTRRFPFDPRRRRMSVVVGDRVLVKGAPDSVLERCIGHTRTATAAAQDLAERGLRVLAVAERPGLDQAPESSEHAEHHLTLLALLGFEDPPRAEAASAIRRCRDAGVRVAMVTGDHPKTAAAVAREVGLALPHAPVLVGADLPDDDAALGALVDIDGAIVARVSPEQKLRIANALQSRHHVVAMTGDGVNDGPALQKADIGVAMGRSGSDVAREAADLVLLDDDFATIVAAVEQGRGTFLNVRRFLTYHLTDNVAELAPLVAWALSATRLPLALGVLQILALDLATDTFSAVALGAEKPHRDVMRRPPVAGRLLNRVVAWRAFGVLGPTEALMGMATFSSVLVFGGWRWETGTPSASLLAAASGGYFLTVVSAQSANAFACRSSTLTPRRLGFWGNRLLLYAVLVELAAALSMLLLPGVARLLGQASPPAVGWTLALASAPALLLVDAADKSVRRRLRSRAPHQTAKVRLPGDT